MSTPVPVLKRGVCFIHKRWLDGSNNQPLKCQITRIARGLMYYRADYGLHDDGTPWLGAPYFIAVEDAGKVIEEIVP